MSALEDPIRVLRVHDGPEFRRLAAERLEAEDDRFRVDTAVDNRRAVAPSGDTLLSVQSLARGGPPP